MHGYSRGPFGLGVSSLLLILSYVALNYGISKRRGIWDSNGQNLR
jgi:hypothetical protein